MNWKSESIDATIRELEVKVADGLDRGEAERRREQYGPNALRAGKRKTNLQRFIEQFKNALIYILLIAAGVSAVFGEWPDAIIIFAIVILNAVIGVIQESKAEAAIEALKKMASPKALVRRGGITQEIDSEQIVPGDVVILEAGRVVPCDIRLVEAANLKVEESALTGESVPVEKDASAVLDAEGVALGDQVNMAFSSTIVTYGRGVGIAVGTGMDTEIGRIAEMLETQETQLTPLQRRLEKFGRALGVVILVLCAVMFGIGILEEFFRHGMIPQDTLLELFLTAVSLAVAAIPEGLPAIVTVVLAIGVQKMSTQNAIVRKLPAVETLGSVNVVCSDKTGTLTQNRMTVVRYYANATTKEIADLNASDSAERTLLEALVHCNDATYTDSSQTGDPTEVALLEAGSKFGIHKEAFASEHPRIAEKPFDSVRKMMSTVGRVGEKARVYTKGALDSVLPQCTHIREAGQTRPLNEPDRKAIYEAAATMSAEALRVLASAYKDTVAEQIVVDDLEQELVFAGLVGMIDPPRMEVKDSIEACTRAGIRTIMITGDHQETAFAIARELGIASAHEQTISGSAIDEMSDEELAERSEQLRVFARVSPEHKVRIVKAFQSRGNLVSMTGDGVNDAPSLKSADIGVAMGITGTDVAKGASDMVLTDDNFQTIVSAIAAGRNIYGNIKKVITFLLSCNAGEIVAIFTAIVVGWRPPLLPIHILWVNLITDSLPALALGMEPDDPKVLGRPPRDPNESLFAGGTGLNVILNGTLIGALTLTAYQLGLFMYEGSVQHARTMAFVVLAVSQLFHAFDLRNFRKSVFQLGLLKNRMIWLAFIVGLLLQWIVTAVPGIARVFQVDSLSWTDWGIVMGLAAVPFVLNELVKLGGRVAGRSGSK